MARDVERRQLGGVALVAALVVLVAFAVLVGVLIAEVDTEERRWARLAWIFTSVEAIAFGAAGAALRVEHPAPARRAGRDGGGRAP